VAAVLLRLIAGAAVLAVPAAGWEARAELPEPRSEVAAAVVGTELAVAGGYLGNGGTSARVDAYSPKRDRWRRLPDLPVAVNHATATSLEGLLYVFGGYRSDRQPVKLALVFDRGKWRRLRDLPAVRAAAGAAAAFGKLYVVGGVGPNGLAKNAFVYDVRSRRWTTIPGPTPREHLAVTTSGGRVYAIAGRTAGIDTNLTLNEVYDPKSRSWKRLAPVPEPRGGTGAAAIATTIVSVGGEQPGGTIGSVYAYDVLGDTWRKLPDLRTPRHGLGVVAAFGRIWTLAGGEEPGLFVSGVNESLALTP
jgi:N-acetylneuraminic acid mutarotase